MTDCDLHIFVVYLSSTPCGEGEEESLVPGAIPLCRVAENDT